MCEKVRQYWYKHYYTPLHKEVVLFTVYFVPDNGTYVAYQDGDFFGTFDNLREAREEIEYWADEKGYMEGVF